MKVSKIVQELDDDAETFGAISASTWFKNRHAVRESEIRAAKLHKALATLAGRMSHYVYSRENREALAEANKVLSEYQPAVEPPTDE